MCYTIPPLILTGTRIMFIEEKTETQWVWLICSGSHRFSVPVQNLKRALSQIKDPFFMLLWSYHTKVHLSKFTISFKIVRIQKLKPISLFQYLRMQEFWESTLEPMLAVIYNRKKWALRMIACGIVTGKHMVLSLKKELTSTCVQHLGSNIP